MKKSTLQDYRNMSEQELSKAVMSAKREFSLMTMQSKMGKLKNVRSRMMLRKNLAAMLTIMTQKTTATKEETV